MYDQLLELKSKVEQFKGILKGEQQTKNVLIEPFLKILGFDIANPFDILTEFTCDFGTKKGEKVDYVLLKGSDNVLLIEAKDCKIRLDQNHVSQLFRYFSVTTARIGLLTNGIDYWFFSDLNNPNTMDTEPFFKFNILDVEKKDVELLSLFKKDDFSVTSIKSMAYGLKFQTSFHDYLKMQIQSPTNEFVKFITKSMNLTGIPASDVRKLLKHELATLLPDLLYEVVEERAQVDEEPTPAPCDTKEAKEYALPLSELKTTRDLVSGSKIAKMTINGEELGVNTWRNALMTLIGYYVKLGCGVDFIKSLDGAEQGGWIHDTDENMKAPRLLENIGLYVDVHMSASNAVLYMTRVCKNANYMIKEEDVVFTFLK